MLKPTGLKTLVVYSLFRFAGRGKARECSPGDSEVVTKDTQGTVDTLMPSPPRIRVPGPEVCDYVTLLVKRTLQMSVKDLELGRLSRIIWVCPNIILKAFVSGRLRQKSQSWRCGDGADTRVVRH